MHWCITVDYQQIENGNIANQIHGFAIVYGKLILIMIIIHETMNFFFLFFGQEPTTCLEVKWNGREPEQDFEPALSCFVFAWVKWSTNGQKARKVRKLFVNYDWWELSVWIVGLG